MSSPLEARPPMTATMTPTGKRGTNERVELARYTISADERVISGQRVRGVVRIVDVKCPASGETAKMDWENLQRLTPTDEVKFVINDRADYEYARDAIHRYGIAGRAAAIHMSPVHGVMDPKTLAEWVLADKLPVRVQLQIHKYIWPADTRGV